MITCSIALYLGLWGGFIFQQDNKPKHTARITEDWLRDHSVNVFSGPARAQT